MSKSSSKWSRWATAWNCTANELRNSMRSSASHWSRRRPPPLPRAGSRSYGHGEHLWMRTDGGDHLSGVVLCRANLPQGRRPHGNRERQSRCAIIAAVKGWHAAFSALLLLIPTGARAADDLNAAARELARKTVAIAGREPVSLTWRNLSSLGSIELGQARGAFEAALREAGGRPAEIAAVAEAQITLSENAVEYLMVEELRKAEERQVFLASWKRTSRIPAPFSGIALEKKLVWEQDEPILDIAMPGDNLL